MANMTNTAEVKSILGFTADVASKLMDAAETAGGRDGYDCLHLLTTPKGQETLAKIGGILADANDREIDKVMVERRISLKDAIELCAFKKVDPRIMEMFTLKDSLTTVVEYVEIATLWAYGEMIMFSTATARLEKQGRRPATLSELLAKFLSPRSVNRGATFALGTVAETPNGKFVCYIDEDCTGKHSLKVCDITNICQVVAEVNERTASRGWILAVREHQPLRTDHLCHCGKVATLMKSGGAIMCEDCAGKHSFSTFVSI